MKSIFKKYKNSSLSLKKIKKDFKVMSIPNSREFSNLKVNLVFPLYAQKVTFFKVTGKLSKNVKSTDLNQILHIESVVSKNKILLKISPNTPLIKIF